MGAGHRLRPLPCSAAREQPLGPRGLGDAAGARCGTHPDVAEGRAQGVVARRRARGAAQPRGPAGEPCGQVRRRGAGRARPPEDLAGAGHRGSAHGRAACRAAEDVDPAGRVGVAAQRRSWPSIAHPAGGREHADGAPAGLSSVQHAARQRRELQPRQHADAPVLSRSGSRACAADDAAGGFAHTPPGLPRLRRLARQCERLQPGRLAEAPVLVRRWRRLRAAHDADSRLANAPRGLPGLRLFAHPRGRLQPRQLADATTVGRCCTLEDDGPDADLFGPRHGRSLQLAFAVAKLGL
mmetsp:Transcript_110929/g.318692  ORF Transcript_110929/g.318692 Transcript_110929/m.318692 type:complete len:296 (+) Transcript_110929:292-1179(+)